MGRKCNAHGKITTADEILVKTHHEQQNTIESKGEEHMSLINVI
jgi:cellobiose-specific phosphotransferase system component IIA